jgi:hypothetical protein
VQKTSLTPNTSLVLEKDYGQRETRLVSATSLTPDTSLMNNTSQNTATLWASIPAVKGHMKFFHQITDHLYRYLDPFEQAVYTQLYRLSWGYGKPNCNIGLPRLAERANISATATQQAIKKLIQKGIVEKLSWTIGKGKEQGTEYRLPLPTSLTPETSLTLDTSLTPNTTIKDHDHDLKDKDHHQNAHARATMTLYQSITENVWTKADQAAYEKIKDVPIEIIESTMKAVNTRAAQRPGSLNYFIKEIIAVANPTPTSRKAYRSQLQPIIERVRVTYAGGRYEIADLEERVRGICEREGLVFDKLIFNEIVG